MRGRFGYGEPPRYGARPYAVLPFMKEIEIAGLLLAWYGSSTMIVICFKSLTSRAELEYGYGSGVTFFVNVLCFFLTSAVVALARNFLYTSSERLPPRVGLLDPQAAPIGALAGLELVAGNLALVQLSMTFRTMLHACTPVMMLAAGVLFGVESLSARACFAVFFLTAGGVLSGLAEGADFHSRGIGIQLVASALATVRWVLVQKLFQQPKEGVSAKHPLKVLDVTRVTSCYVALVAGAMTICIEPAALGPVGVLFGADADAAGALRRHLPVIGTFVSVAAAGVCLLMWAEMRLTALTSALTVSVAAALHNVPIIVAGCYTFQEQINVLHVCSFALVMVGTLLYIAIRAEQEPQAPKEEKPMLYQVADDAELAPEMTPFLVPLHKA